MPRFRRPRPPVHRLRQVTAAALVCLALVLALRPPPPAAGAGAEQPTTPVAVAAADLPAGTVLAVDDLTAVRLPARAAPTGVYAVPADLQGRVLAAPVRAGEPITDVRVVGPGLWSAVPEGLVAAPVRLADLAVSTLLRAGDRVDVLATTATGDGGPPVVEVVAAAALVLAASTDDARAGPAAGAPADAGLVVLAVEPGTARDLAAASSAATLTATLGRP